MYKGESNLKEKQSQTINLTPHDSCIYLSAFNGRRREVQP